MSRFIVTPVCGTVARFVVNSEKVVGLAKLHTGGTLITTKIEGQAPAQHHVMEGFDGLAAKMKECYLKRAVVTPVGHHSIAKFMVASDKLCGLHETHHGETVLSFKPSEYAAPIHVEIEESIEAVLAAL